MNDTAIRSLSPALQLEIETLRDQRDLYRSLLLSEPAPLAQFMNSALESIERIRSLLRAPTREAIAFRGKLEQLRAELATLTDSMLSLHLPTIQARLTSAQSALCEIETRAEISGNDLLPAMVVLEELCSHITIAADCAAVHVPLEIEDGVASELTVSQRRAQPKLAAALHQLATAFAAEQEKRVALVTMGLEEIPQAWVGTLFDLLGALLRNAIEHGIEPPSQRAACHKPETGTLVAELVDRGPQGFELNVQDDGQGLDAERLTEVAVRRGLLDAEAAGRLSPARLVSLIFQPGLSTASDSTRRGQGMQIVRDHVHRLQGRIQVSTKRGHFTRYRIHLPAPAAESRPDESVRA